MITNFPSHGIEVSNGGTLPPSVTIAGNYIGTDGTNDLGNARLTPADNGILVSGRSATIGGTTAADRNVISGNGSADTNGGSGIRVNGGIGGSVVQGNYIGLTANGVTALGQKYGVTVQQNGVTIGGTAAGAGNVISGNAHSGINLTGANATNAVIEGNFIGTNAAGIGAVENTQHAILLNLAGNRHDDRRRLGGKRQRDRRRQQRRHPRRRDVGDDDPGQLDRCGRHRELAARPHRDGYLARRRQRLRDGGREHDDRGQRDRRSPATAAS